ncbi:hypothetical protein [Allocoleopsis sp.]|uniref:hypothetical protein n=1 Tax=Allocoleopsis sp. TaxID=3088169 RepID=UPI002FD6C1FD
MSTANSRLECCPVIKNKKHLSKRKKMKYEQKIRTKTEQKEESVNVLWRELEETEQEQTRGGVDRFDPLGLVADGDQSDRSSIRSAIARYT